MAITYPYRVFRYSVEIKGISRAGFSEVSGMDASTDVVEYREGDDLRNTPRKLTGLTKFSNVTFRWGVSDDKEFLDWIYLVQPKNPLRLPEWRATISRSLSSTTPESPDRLGRSSTHGRYVTRLQISTLSARRSRSRLSRCATRASR